MGGENDNGAAVGERLGAPVFCLRFFREDASIFRFAQCQVCSANIAASSMHKCVICPSDVVCASRVKSSKANIISLRNEVEQYHFCEAKISR